MDTIRIDEMSPRQRKLLDDLKSCMVSGLITIKQIGVKRYMDLRGAFPGKGFLEVQLMAVLGNEELMQKLQMQKLQPEKSLNPIVGGQKMAGLNEEQRDLLESLRDRLSKGETMNWNDIRDQFGKEMGELFPGFTYHGVLRQANIDPVKLRIQEAIIEPGQSDNHGRGGSPEKRVTAKPSLPPPNPGAAKNTGNEKPDVPRDKLSYDITLTNYQKKILKEVVEARSLRPEDNLKLYFRVRAAFIEIIRSGKSFADIVRMAGRDPVALGIADKPYRPRQPRKTQDLRKRKRGIKARPTRKRKELELQVSSSPYAFSKVSAIGIPNDLLPSIIEKLEADSPKVFLLIGNGSNPSGLFVIPKKEALVGALDMARTFFDGQRDLVKRAISSLKTQL